MSVAAVSLSLMVGCSAIENITMSVFGYTNAGLVFATEPAGTPLWKAEVQPAGSGPVIADETVVSYIVVEDQLMLAGFDLHSGKQRWAHAAETGSTVYLAPKLFTATDGRTLAINTTTPVRRESDDGSFFWRHPLQVIDVASGEVAATTPLEWWTGGGRECVIPHHFCMIGQSPGMEGSTYVGVNEFGEYITDPDDEVLPNMVRVIDWSNNDRKLAVGEGAAGEHFATYVEDGKSLWEIPLTELGFDSYEPIGAPYQGYVDTVFSVTHLPEDNVLLVDVTRRPIIDDSFTQQAFVTALDTQTGEKLWSKSAELCRWVQR